MKWMVGGFFCVVCGLDVGYTPPPFSRRGQYSSLFRPPMSTQYVTNCWLDFSLSRKVEIKNTTATPATENERKKWGPPYYKAAPLCVRGGVMVDECMLGKQAHLLQHWR